MDLKPLVHDGDVAPMQFADLFRRRLGDLYPRAIANLMTLDRMHSYPVANVIELGLQKGNVLGVIEALEKWCKIYPTGLPVTRDVDTRQYFDMLYAEFFMQPEDTMNGVNLSLMLEGEPVEHEPPQRRLIILGEQRPTGRQLILP